MNVSKQWIDALAALRDPDAKKTTNHLGVVGDVKSGCAMGHICRGIGIDRFEVEDSVFYGKKKARNSSVMPKEACRKLNCNQYVSFREPVLAELREWFNVVQLNDSTDLSLLEIADILEAQVKSGNVVAFSKGIEDRV